MKIFLAGNAPWSKEKLYDDLYEKYRPYILGSFFYTDGEMERLLPYCGDFLLDSGAFTVRLKKDKQKIDWDEYVELYGAWIKKNGVKKFIELDIDNVIGYDNVLRLTEKLEKIVGLPSIPVWHKNRGKDAFIRMCQKYPYVSLGGIVGGTKEDKAEYHRLFPWFIKVARQNKAKIHCLGYTSVTGLKKNHFDSVDSSSWLYGNQYGNVWIFHNGDIKMLKARGGGRIKDQKALARHNFEQWILFQRYGEIHL